MKKDIMIKFYTDATAYMALKARADMCERTISQHVRYLVRLDLEKACQEQRDGDKDNEGSMEGQG